MRHPHPGEGTIRPKAPYHPEGAAVDATGSWHEGHWHEGHASYPGRSALLPSTLTGVTGVLPAPSGVGTGRQKSAETVVVEPIDEGSNMIGRSGGATFRW
jgi:hypothetical protein